MLSSSGDFESDLEGGAASHDGPENVDASARQGDDGLMMAFALAACSVVESSAVGVAEGSEGADQALRFIAV